MGGKVPPGPGGGGIGFYLAAEVAEEFGVLADLNLLNLLPQTCAVSRAILSDDAHLLRPLRLRTSTILVSSRLAPTCQAAAGQPELSRLVLTWCMNAAATASTACTGGAPPNEDGTQHARTRTMVSRDEAQTRKRTMLSICTALPCALIIALTWTPAESGVFLASKRHI